MTGAPTCPGWRRDPHEVRFTYADGLCPGCSNRRDSESDRDEMGPAAHLDDDQRREATRA